MASEHESDTNPTGGAATLPDAQAAPSRRRAPRPSKPKPLPVWQVVLLDDDEHTYAYVIEMLGKVFGHGVTTAAKMASEVDRTGRVIVFRAHRELVELKAQQITSYGADLRLEACSGSMRAVCEPG